MHCNLCFAPWAGGEIRPLLAAHQVVVVRELAVAVMARFNGAIIEAAVAEIHPGFYRTHCSSPTSPCILRLKAGLRIG